ncbi:hypothetical protein BWD07_07635 [Neisseria canis]|nr:hypothetical protein BWD07_07635 [Neisseria canis]
MNPGMAEKLFFNLFVQAYQAAERFQTGIDLFSSAPRPMLQKSFFLNLFSLLFFMGLSAGLADLCGATRLPGRTRCAAADDQPAVAPFCHCVNRRVTDGRRHNYATPDS